MASVRRNTVVVKGYTQLVRAFAQADEDLNMGMKRTLYEVGEVVRVDAATHFSNHIARSAAGFRTVVLQKGVDVRQMLKKTTGDHPEYGALQMTDALLPALDAKEGEVEGKFESFLDRVVAKNFG